MLSKCTLISLGSFSASLPLALSALKFLSQSTNSCRCWSTNSSKSNAPSTTQSWMTEQFWTWIMNRHMHRLAQTDRAGFYYPDCWHRSIVMLLRCKCSIVMIQFVHVHVNNYMLTTISLPSCNGSRLQVWGTWCNESRNILRWHTLNFSCALSSLLKSRSAFL